MEEENNKGKAGREKGKFCKIIERFLEIIYLLICIHKEEHVGWDLF